MNEISTEVKDAVILFFDGSKRWINQEQYLELMFTDKNENFIIDSQRYTMASVKKILSREEYFIEYPNDKIDIPKMFENLPYKKNKNALPMIIKGLREYISSSKYQGNDAPKELLKKYERRLINLEK